MTPPLLTTKLYIPSIRPKLVSRPRLIERLNAGLPRQSASLSEGRFARKLTLVSAPAGFGKTTLVSEWVQALDKVTPPVAVAWLSLDQGDNDLTRFLAYLVAALRTLALSQVEGIEADVGKGVLGALESPQPPPTEAILTALINEIATIPDPIVLVLDDYHLIKAQPIHDALSFLLQHLPPQMHLVIASRSDPPLPLARLRACDQMIELRTADLRFTAPEAAQFMNDVMGLDLDAGSVTALEERTEGWIAGLQMASIAVRSLLSMRGRQDVDSLIQAFAGTNRFIMDYLLEEVLAREPEGVQTFLLQTVILTRLSGPLCDAVTGNSGGQEMLERLEQRNLFIVPLDDDRRWYRYHHLFADLLQARLYQSGADRVARLLSRAAEWCEENGQVAEAVGYALAAQDYGRAADLVARYWHHMANKGEIETVWSWLKALPEDTVRNSALLGLAYCWVLWLKGQIGAIEPHLVDAENALSKVVSSTDDAAHAHLPAHLAVLRSIVARYGNDFESAVAFAERALCLAPENLPPQDNAQLHTVIFMALASAHEGAGDLEQAVDAYAETIRWSRLGANAAGVTGMTHWLIGALWLLGRLRAADEACQKALSYLQEQGMARLPVTGIMHLRMSEILLERNDLKAAETHLSRGTELGKWSGRFDAALNAAPVLVRLRQAQGDASGALAAVQEAESALGESPSSLSRAGLLALRAKILIWQGALTEAERCVEEAVRLAGQDRGQTGGKVALSASRVMLAQRKPDKAIVGLTQSLAAAEASGRFGVALELRILRSLALVRQGDIQGARADLERALALAEPGGYVRIFLDEGQPIQMLLAQWLAHADAGPLRDYAIHLLFQFDAELHVVTAAQEKASPTGDPSTSSGQALVEPLSQRELEVLHLIALGRTNKEIAQQLIVAPGTVKAHTASIYRKLDVANRTEAAARARQLGILP